MEGEMFGWLRRLFTPPKAPPRSNDFEFISVNRTVILNGETLEGEDADRVGKIVRESTDEIFRGVDKSFATLDEMIDRLNAEGRRQQEKKTPSP